ncbi:hypothetical protein D9M72_458710 [compost metagenome]
MRNARNQPASHPGYGEDQEDHTRDEDRAQRLLPGEAEGSDDGEGEEGVEAHAGRHADRPVGDERHDGGAECGGDTGCDEDGIPIHARARQDVGVDEDDVGHRQECRDTGDHLGARRRLMLFQLE